LNAAHLDRRLVPGAARFVGMTEIACAQTGRPRNLTVFKTPICACCDGWIAHNQPS
jgi:hypothetical protein